MLKKIFAVALSALFACATSATTLAPIQLLNPVGSTAGQAIISTGSSSAPTWGSVAATSLAAQAANTVVANITAASASPTAVALPTCNTSTSALQYTPVTGFTCYASLATTTGTLAQFAGTTSAQLAGIISDETGSGALVFGTNPTITGATISGGTGSFTTLAASSTVSGTGFTSFLAAPPAIGGTTPAAGTFTTATATTVTAGAGGIGSSGGLSVSNGGASITGGLAVTGTVSGTGFSNYLASPPAIGGTAPSTGKFTTLTTTAQSKVIANNQNAQSIPNNTSTVVTTWTSVLNQGSNFNASTGVYTAPAAGTYSVKASVQFASAAWTAGNLIAIEVRQNGTVIYRNTHIIEATVTQPLYTYPIAVTLNCAANDTISVSVLQTQGGAVALAGSATSGYVMIEQLP